MKLVFSLTYSFLLWLLIFTIFTLLILMPRGTPSYDWSNDSKVDQWEEYKQNITSFSWEDYKENVATTLRQVIKEKSLGQTVYLHSVEYEIWRYLKRSFLIIIPAFLLSLTIGIIKGIYDFSTNRSRFNWLGEKATSLFLAVPDFFLIILIQLLILYSIDLGFPHIDIFGHETFINKALAVLFLSMYPTFYIAKITSVSLQDEDKKDYVRTAQGKGTPIWRIVSIHMLKNCWVKIFSHLNTLMLYILSNLFIVELLTSYRGAAYLFYKSFNIKTSFYVGTPFDIDVPIIIGLSFSFTFILLISNWISQIITFMNQQKA
ncbi:ABC transporter permease subunit [Cytobacillus suaedae]|nr:ABC transporter permease subunit [Cytobacillus suaedae]